MLPQADIYMYSCSPSLFLCRAAVSRCRCCLSTPYWNPQFLSPSSFTRPSHLSSFLSLSSDCWRRVGARKKPQQWCLASTIAVVQAAGMKFRSSRKSPSTRGKVGAKLHSKTWLEGAPRVTPAGPTAIVPPRKSPLTRGKVGN
jgi:hypothetical protein